MASIMSFFSSSSLKQQQEVPFGKAFREKYYSFEKDIVPVNHGSYGAPPTAVLEAYQEHMLEDIRYPDRYLRFTGLEKFEKASEVVAEIVDADPNSVVLVQNATTAINTVLRSYPFERGDKIVIHSTVYGACGNTVKFLENRMGVEIVVVHLSYPMEDDDVIKAFEDIFKASKIKLAMFDAVTSMPGVKIPFERIIALCHKYDVLSLVDGAHSVGLIQYSISQLKPDFYTSNLHKWYSTPRGCAFLYVDVKHHRKIHTMPVSHSYLDDNFDLPEELEKKRLVDRFKWTGSVTLAPAVSVIEARKFRNDICGGEVAIRTYTHDLAEKAAVRVAEIWGTSFMNNSTDTLITSMFNVIVPMPDRVVEELKSIEFMEKARVWMELQMFNVYKTFIPTAMHNGKLWARFSAEIYNEMSDYEYAAEVMLKVLKDFLKSDIYKSKISE